MIDTQPQVKNSELFGLMAEMEHEQLVFCHDEATGLKAIIAIHNTVLGPAMGGTRLWNYTVGRSRNQRCASAFTWNDI